MNTLAANSKETIENKGQKINEFSIHVATVNGSGSQSSNTVLMRSIFQMGIPVSGKNLFPSNIMDLPTWFTIRVNKNGYVARTEHVDILVAMNPQTAVEDVKSLPKDAVCISPIELNLDKVRQDVIHYLMPFSQLAVEATENIKLRKLLTNIIYVDVVAHILEIDQAEIDKAIAQQFEDKEKAITLNVNAAMQKRKWTQENIKKTDPFKVERLDKTKGKIIIDGNGAAALDCMFAGVSVVTWYPITPSSSLCEQLIDYLEQYRKDKKTDKATYAVVQTEDELAAVDMALGADWTDARSMTSTSDPGISLMSEFAEFDYFTEIPTVIFDVQRIGPSTGLPTRTSQTDLMSTYLLSHDDTKHPVLLPGSVDECFDFALETFNLAERLQQPVFVLTDLDLDMNNWMSDPFNYPTTPMNRDKVLSKEELEKLDGFSRYKDVDDDGIPYRTIPDTEHPKTAYFTRGSGHNEDALYSERSTDYVNLMNRLNKKTETARKIMPKPVIDKVSDAKIDIIAFGSNDFAVLENRDQLKEAKMPISYLRLRSLPVNQEVVDFVNNHDRVYVVEQNRDAQLQKLIIMNYPELAPKLVPVTHYTDLPIDAQFITDNIVKKEQEKK